LIHFDFDERYADELVVGSAISRREGVVLSVGVHVLVLLAIVFLPTLAIFELSPEELEQQRQEELARLQQRENSRFVFVNPRIDLETLRPRERADLSDLNRRSQTAERAVEPANPLPFSRGNSAERTESAEAAPPPRGPETPEPPNVTQPQPQPEEQVARALPPNDEGLARPRESATRPSGALGDALRNLQKYVQNQTFNNPQGGTTDPGAQIQFDTKGVEFGPWLRRFVAQVRRNWFVPYAAMTFRGRVVLQFNIHKNGRITDIAVFQPSEIDAFNRAAYNAILGSSPTEPLPPEYPEDKAFFTVTFYYNEQPIN
jgi:TonB family protein